MEESHDPKSSSSSVSRGSTSKGCPPSSDVGENDISIILKPSMPEESPECPRPDDDQPQSAQDLQKAWLRRCLPIIAQPRLDVENQNQLIKIFYRFEPDDAEIVDAVHCHLAVVYAGEASYDLAHDRRLNHVATLCYRSFNRKVYRRTADINYLEYRHVNVESGCDEPWRTIVTNDHGGDQTWSHGDRGKVLSWLSFMRHYHREIPSSDWTFSEDDPHRPVMYLNTCNHMWGHRDNNPHLEKVSWRNYPIQEGGAKQALVYAQRHVPTKPNCYSWLCFCRAWNGGGCCDRHRHEIRSGESFHVVHEEDLDHVQSSGVSSSARSRPAVYVFFCVALILSLSCLFIFLLHN